MKEHGSKLPAEQPVKILKSLLKKPGQSKARSQKNRVVINEKLNEFFAADYIILIKEECCADYEEDCDCCCQEHELIRLGSCKECRAELNLHFAVSDNDHDVERVCGSDRFACVELHVDGEEVEVEEEEIGAECDEGDDEEDEEDEKGGKRKQRRKEKQVQEKEERPKAKEEIEKLEWIEAQSKKKGERIDAPNEREDRKWQRLRPADRGIETISVDTTSLPSPPTAPAPLSETPLSTTQPASLPRQEHQQETLSPPEGYKDVCSNDDVTDARLHSSFDYLPCQTRATDAASNAKSEGTVENKEEAEEEEGGEEVEGEEEKTRRFDNEQRATSNESRHRYLVETITMTTVTERRIVREISEEEEERIIRREVVGDPSNESSSSNNNSDEWNSCTPKKTNVEQAENESGKNEERIAHSSKMNLGDDSKEDSSSLSLVFKLGNYCLAGNSLKPNSAVRQLFPNPKFVSPPPGPAGKLIASTNSLDNPNDMTAKLLVNSDSLRDSLLDSRKRSNTSDDLIHSFEEQPNLIKRTIERNTLRRSLLDKYRATSRKKSGLSSKNLSLEERIRQLTCVDQEEEQQECFSSTDMEIESELLIRSSPSGQEESTSLPLSTTLFAESAGTDKLTATTAAALLPITEFDVPPMITIPIPSLTTSTTWSDFSSTPPTTYQKQNSLSGTAVGSGNGQRQHAHNHSQSTYRKLTDLFVPKKSSNSNMPDLGLGKSPNVSGKDYHQSGTKTESQRTKTNNSDMRKQFLASLAPLSCVTVNSTDAQEEYYRHSSRMAGNESRPMPANNYNHMRPYNLEEIEESLREDDRNYVGPPDVTKGTPVIVSRPDIADNMVDELLAFVEQDKFRTERIKRRYEVDGHYFSTNSPTNYNLSNINNGRIDRIADGKNESEDNQSQLGVGGGVSLLYQQDCSNSNVNTCRGELHSHNIVGYRYDADIENNAERKRTANDNHTDANIDRDANEDDEDDELNDYGFNRRPTVTGIKQRPSDGSDQTFHRMTILVSDDSITTTAPAIATTTTPAIATTTTMTMIPVTVAAAAATATATTTTTNTTSTLKRNFLHDPATTLSPPIASSYYRTQTDGQIPSNEEAMDDFIPSSFLGNLIAHDRDTHTINRINTMQKQIDDIYQTIVENTNVTVQNAVEHDPYTDDAFARQQVRLPLNSDASYRFYQEQRNTGQQFIEQFGNLERRQQEATSEAEGFVDVPATDRDFANGIPATARRTLPPNYRCNATTSTFDSTCLPSNGKCYRTMYFVPYNGVSDPTYQNIQRILPSHPSPSYATHIERYPYPRANKNDHQLQAQPEVQPQAQSQQQFRYYQAGNRSLSPISNTTFTSPVSSATLLPPHSIQSPPSMCSDSRLASIASFNSITVQPPQHLHLRHHQRPEDLQSSAIGFSSVPNPTTNAPSLQLHYHHRHYHPSTLYRLPAQMTCVPAGAPASSSYTVIAPSRCTTFGAAAHTEMSTAESSYQFYQVELGRTVVAPSSSSSELQQSYLHLPSSSIGRTACPSATPPLAAVTAVASQPAVLPNPAKFHVASRSPTIQSVPSNLTIPPSFSSSSTSSSCSFNSSSSSSSSSSCSSSSSLQIPSSPSKVQQQPLINGTACTAGERGMPEGAPSAPSHDTPPQPAILLTSNSYIARNPTAGIPLQSHVQNSVYYAMNV